MAQHTTQSQIPPKQLMFCRNQDAPRNYTQVMLCFATDDPKAALSHLKSSVEFLRAEYPFFNARLSPEPDFHRLNLLTSREYELPYIGSSYTPKTYGELRGGGFATEDLCEVLAQKADVDKVRSWTTPDPAAAPGAHPVPATLVHAVALDRGLVIRLHVCHALFDGHMRNHFVDCLAAATRRVRLEGSPSSTRFPFDYDRGPTKPLSSYICISSLTFAHVVKARLRGEGYRYLPKTAHARTAILRHEVDEEYVRARLAVAETVSDPRRLGLDYDPRQPQVLGLNSWRHTGGAGDWHFPPGAPQKPAAFRLARGYSMRNALILPQRRGTGDQDVLVSLSERAMNELLQDAGWMRWVGEVRD